MAKSAAVRTLSLPFAERQARSNRPHVLYLRLSTDERQRLNQAALDADMPVTVWARAVLLQAKGAARR